MVFKYDNLIKQIEKYGWEDFFKNTNIGISNLLSILFYGKEFSLKEISEICSMLEIKSPKEIRDIFFTIEVEKKQPKLC